MVYLERTTTSKFLHQSLFLAKQSTSKNWISEPTIDYPFDGLNLRIRFAFELLGLKHAVKVQR